MKTLITAIIASLLLPTLGIGQDASTTTLTGQLFLINSVAFSPDGKRIASDCLFRHIKLWDAQSGKELMTLKGHSAVVTSVAFSPDGQWIASGSWDKTIKLWDVQTGKELKSFPHSGPVQSVAYRPDGQWIASGSADGSALQGSGIIRQGSGIIKLWHVGDIRD